MVFDYSVQLINTCLCINEIPLTQKTTTIASVYSRKDVRSIFVLCVSRFILFTGGGRGKERPAVWSVLIFECLCSRANVSTLHLWWCVSMNASVWTWPTERGLWALWLVANYQWVELPCWVLTQAAFTRWVQLWLAKQVTHTHTHTPRHWERVQGHGGHWAQQREITSHTNSNGVRPRSMADQVMWCCLAVTVLLMV